VSVGFLSRWARKKSLQDELDRRLESSEADGKEEAPESQPTQVPDALQTSSPQESAQPEGPAPTMADVAALPPGADVSRFMGLDVSDEVRSAALKRLFSAPEYNVRSTMDVYWEDYSNLPKLSQEEVRSLAQSKSLYLFEDPPWKSQEESPDVLPALTTSGLTEPADPADPAEPAEQARPAEPTTDVPTDHAVSNASTVVLAPNDQLDPTTHSPAQPMDPNADSVASHPKGSS
jgi:hypothetical protein